MDKTSAISPFEKCVFFTSKLSFLDAARRTIRRLYPCPLPQQCSPRTCVSHPAWWKGQRHFWAISVGGLCKISGRIPLAPEECVLCLNIFVGLPCSPAGSHIHLMNMWGEPLLVHILKMQTENVTKCFVASIEVFPP